MLNSIGLQGPGLDGLLERLLPALAPLGVPIWVSVGGFSAQDYAASCERLDERDDVGDRRAEPLLPERRRGARDGRGDRRRGPRRDDQAAVREALTRHVGHRRVGARLRGRGRRRAVARQHDSRAGARAADRCGRRSVGRPGATRGRRSALSLSPASTPAPRRSTCPSSGWAEWRRGADALDLVAAGATAVALGTVLFSDPGAAGRIRAELEAEVALARVRICTRASPSRVVHLEKILQFPGKVLA